MNHLKLAGYIIHNLKQNAATLYYKNNSFRLIEDWYPLFLPFYGGTCILQLMHPIVNCAVKIIDIYSLL